MGLFSSASPLEKLNKEYEKLLKDSHRLSTINRLQSDKKYVEAQAVLEKIIALEKKD
jgi:hypothetical protein